MIRRRDPRGLMLTSTKTNFYAQLAKLWENERFEVSIIILRALKVGFGAESAPKNLGFARLNGSCCADGMQSEVKDAGQEAR